MVRWGLYVHLPYCRMKCHYCDFNVYAVGPPGDRADRVAQQRFDRYLPALEAELDHYNKLVAANGPVNSVYFGGGTPSLLSPAQLTQLKHGLLDRVPVAPGAEITLECNPDDMDAPRLEAMRSVGVNRLSIGLQSAQADLLRRIGRLHDVEGFNAAYGRARRAGFDSVGVDIMLGLPGQRVSDIDETLDYLLTLGPDHVSAYGLQIDEGSAFWQWQKKGLLHRPDESDELDMYRRVIERLTDAGYRHYEISNFALPGHESRHNLGYWQFADYLGLGAGAHSFVGDHRWSNVRYPGEYASQLASGQTALAEKYQVPTAGLESEFMLMGLRLLAGVDENSFVDRFGRSIEEAFGEPVARLQENGLLENAEGKLRLTDHGLPLANFVFREFVQ